MIFSPSNMANHGRISWFRFHLTLKYIIKSFCALQLHLFWWPGDSPLSNIMVKTYDLIAAMLPHADQGCLKA